MMEIAITVAMTPKGLIGKDNQIPWHQPADLQRFKKHTMGHPLVMGRKTFESLPRLLPGRQHIVLTRNEDYQADGCDVITDWKQIEEITPKANKVFVIGGADIYKVALPIAKYLYMTIVYTELEGDTYFPEWNKSEWEEESREFRAKDEKNKFDMEYICYLHLSN